MTEFRRRSTDNKDEQREDQADLAQRNALERHVAMRLTAIIKAEEQRKRTTRNWIIAGVLLFITLVLGGLIFLVVNLSAVTEEQRKDSEITKKRLHATCLARNEQAKAVKNLVANLTSPANRATVPRTAAQEAAAAKTLESLLAFERSFAMTTNCENFLK